MQSAALVASGRETLLIAFRTAAVYACVLLGFRVSGKREVGMMAPFDFALILLVANAVQNAMVGPDVSLTGGLVAAAVLFLINAGLGHLASRSRNVERLLRGRARILVKRGRIDPEGLREESLSHEELMQALRENGCATVEECRLAVLEPDGTISVITEQKK